MNRFVSVGAILSAITGLFVVLLVLLSADIAFGAFQRERAATNTLAIVRAERRITSAKEELRAELAGLNAAFHDPAGASAAAMEHISATHARLDTGLAAVAQVLAAYAGKSDPGRAEIAGKAVLYDRKYARAVVALESPGAGRDRGLIADWRESLVSLMDALNAQANILARDIPKTDDFLNQMAEVNMLSWNVRVAAGNERRLLAIATANGRLSINEQFKLSAAAGGIDSLWATIEGDARFAGMPGPLKIAVQRADTVYFTQFRALRKQAIDRLAQGKGAMMPEEEWMRRSNPGLNSIAEVSKTALDLMEAHCEDLARIASMNFAAAVGLMLISLALAHFTVFYIFRQVIRPLKLITRTVGDFAADTPGSNVPFTDRQDEIGDFARTFQKFRTGELERQRLKAQLLINQAEKLAADTSNRMKSEFLANMSHELRTPLNAIIGFSELIRSEVQGPGLPRYRAYADDIHGAGKHLLSLINDILDMTRVEAGKLDLHPEAVDLQYLIAECVRLMRERASEKGLHIILDLAPLPPLFVDRLRVKQVLLNLLSNAIKFTEKGDITVEAGRDGDGRTVISVRDTGIGIEPDKIAQLFEPFQQVDSALSRKYEGTGLGLYLVKKLIALHDGEVRIESLPGAGTSVNILFPASREMPATQCEQIAGADEMLAAVGKR